MTLSGRVVAAASVAIGIDEVLEARIASRRQDGVGAPEDLRLHVGVLDHGFDQEIG